MITRRKMIKIAYKHMNEYYAIPTFYTYAGDMTFIQKCYAAIAAKNIVHEIESLDNTAELLNMLGDLVTEYNDAACNATFDDANFMFSVAADVATDFVDLYIFLK